MDNVINSLFGGNDPNEAKPFRIDPTEIFHLIMNLDVFLRTNPMLLMAVLQGRIMVEERVDPMDRLHVMEKLFEAEWDLALGMGLIEKIGPFTTREEFVKGMAELAHKKGGLPRV